MHRSVNHKAGEFSRQDVNVTTNAVEGLFGRLKKYLRQREYARFGKRAYGEVLTEFLWRAEMFCLPRGAILQLAERD